MIIGNITLFTVQFDEATEKCFLKGEFSLISGKPISNLMNKLFVTMILLSLAGFGCGGSESKGDEQQDAAVKSEIIKNDSIATELESVEEDINKASESLNDALNDLEVE